MGVGFEPPAACDHGSMLGLAPSYAVLCFVQGALVLAQPRELRLVRNRVLGLAVPAVALLLGVGIIRGFGEGAGEPDLAGGECDADPRGALRLGAGLASALARGPPRGGPLLGRVVGPLGVSPGDRGRASDRGLVPDAGRADRGADHAGGACRRARSARRPGRGPGLGDAADRACLDRAPRRRPADAARPTGTSAPRRHLPGRDDGVARPARPGAARGRPAAAPGGRARGGGGDGGRGAGLGAPALSHFAHPGHGARARRPSGRLRDDPALERALSEARSPLGRGPLAAVEQEADQEPGHQKLGRGVDAAAAVPAVQTMAGEELAAAGSREPKNVLEVWRRRRERAGHGGIERSAHPREE